MLTLFKRYIATIVLSVTAMALVGCGDKGDDPQPNAARAVLVYMVADNSLGSGGYDQLDIDEMISAANAGFGDSRLIIYHDGTSGTPTLDEITPTGRQTLKSYTLDQVSVSSSRMEQVIADFKQQAPADNYGIILWSHANGWLQNGMESPSTVSEKTFGEQRGRHMNVTTLAEVLNGKGFDYIYFDCCYMGSVEVAYELRGAARYMVGCPTELPANGMPYDQTLPYLMAADADLQAACKATFDSYNAKSGASRTCTISLIDLQAMDRLAEATRAIFATHPTLPDGFSAQKYMTSSCYLFDFGQYVSALSSDDEAAATWRAALADAVIYEAATPKLWNSIALTYHSGLSTYILSNESDAYSAYNYNQLQWWSDVASALFN